MRLMHGRFSRWIGPLPQPKQGLAGWVVLTLIAAALLFAFVAHPIASSSIVAGLVLLAIVDERTRSRRVIAIANERIEEDIGSFARAFDRRTCEVLDPWAIRAVWDVLVPLTDSSGRKIPLRPTDRFKADLLLDADDLEDVVPQLVEQCERVAGNWQANPFYGRLDTVADLVHFISAQPLASVNLFRTAL